MRQGKGFCVSVILAGVCLAVVPGAQAQSDQQTSVADAARKAREQKKAAPKESQVITNDTLEPPKLKPEITIPTATEPTMPGTTASAAGAPATGTAAADSKATAATNAKGEDFAENDEEAKKALEALKQQIREMKKEVDLAQRALSLANEDFYSHPDFAKDTDGKAKLDAMINELSGKKDELAQLLAKLPAGETADEPKQTQPQPQ